MNTSSTSSNTTSNSIDFNNSPNEDTPLLNTNDIKAPKTSSTPLSIISNHSKSAKRLDSDELLN